MTHASTQTSRRRLFTFASGLLALALTGCGGLPEGTEQDDVGTIQSEINGGWTTLTLLNGWQAAGTSYHTPAVGKVNGVVVFRGALKATSPTSNVAFSLPAAFAPADHNGFSDAASVRTKIVLSGGTGGSLTYDPFTHKVSISQDGLAVNAIGAAAKAFTSLDGASYDANVGSAVSAPSWDGYYTWRPNDGNFKGYVKNVDGFVRFQGLLHKTTDGDFNNYIFTIPSQFRPGNTVWAYANIGHPGNPNEWSVVTIYPSGDVWVDGTAGATWPSGVHLDGVSFSKTVTGNVALPLSNGWTAYSARSVKVGNFGGVIRFQGAISGGTSTTIGTLPSTLRPTKTVVLPTYTNGTTARITITSSGVMTVANPGGLSVSSLFLSLDGVSFGI
jgi:hypothetical protein